MNEDMGSELRTFLNALKLEIKGTKVLILLLEEIFQPSGILWHHLG